MDVLLSVVDLNESLSLIIIIVNVR